MENKSVGYDKMTEAATLQIFGRKRKGTAINGSLNGIQGSPISPIAEN